MKKLWILIFSVLVIISISGCIFDKISNGDLYSLQEKQINKIGYSIIKEYNKTSYVYSLLIDDLNNDENKEIIYTSLDDKQDNLIHILDASWDIKSTCLLGNSGNGREKIVLDDINDDGKKEIISAGSKYNSNLRYGYENYTLKIFDSNCTKLKEFTISKDIEETVGLYVTDIDNDGEKEIIIGIGKISIIKNNKIENLSYTASSLYVDDINDDNKKEILAGDNDIILVLDNEGKLLWKYSTKDWISEIYTGDIDSDGKKEIIVNSDGVYILSSEGNLIKKLDIETSGKIFISDLDGDGNNELVVGSYVYDSKINLKWKYDLQVGDVNIGDLDNDDKIELVIIAAEIIGTNVPSATIFVFDAAGDLLWNYKHDTWINSITLNDINNDGNKEIIIGGQSLIVFGKK